MILVNHKLNHFEIFSQYVKDRMLTSVNPISTIYNLIVTYVKEISRGKAI